MSLYVLLNVSYMFLNYLHLKHICINMYLNVQVYVCDMYASAPWQLSRNKLYIAFEFS